MDYAVVGRARPNAAVEHPVVLSQSARAVEGVAGELVPTAAEELVGCSADADVESDHGLVDRVSSREPQVKVAEGAGTECACQHVTGSRSCGRTRPSIHIEKLDVVDRRGHTEEHRVHE